MRILYITTVARTMSFLKMITQKLIMEGHQVDLACNMDDTDVDEIFYDLGCNVYNLSCSRSPIKKENLKAISEIRTLVKQNLYDVVHCHTPIAAACTRIACNTFRKDGLRVIYTAHGFHFFKGSAILNWIIYYPIEWICSWLTDTIITINTEDYAIAKKRFHSKTVEYVPGVGIDTEKFERHISSPDEKRRELGIPVDAFLVLSVGELNQNKNHELVINAISQMSEKIYFVIAGEGGLHERLIEIAKEKNIDDRVLLLGYRNDIPDLFECSNVLIHPSFREGLSVTIMEAMASKLPILCSDIRGNRDLVHERCLFNPYSVEDLQKKLTFIISIQNNNVDDIVQYNFNNVKKNDITNINNKLMKIYNNVK